MEKKRKKERFIVDCLQENWWVSKPNNFGRIDEFVNIE